MLRRASIAEKVNRADSTRFAKFTLAYRVQGKRLLRSFSDLKGGRQKAERLLTNFSQDEFEVLTLR